MHGIYSTTQITLSCFDAPNGTGKNKTYTVVLSQYENYDITFTLCAFSTVPLKIKQIPITLGKPTNERKLKGEWKDGLKQSDINSAVTKNERQKRKGNSYRISVVVSTVIRLQLQAPKEVAISISSMIKGTKKS